MCNGCNEDIVNIQNGEILDWNKVNSLKNNSMLKVRPDLWNEWDFEKNDKLGYDIWKMTKGSEKKAWWICPKCDSSFNARIDVRCRGCNCKFCAGQSTNRTNSLASLRSDVAKEWHPTLNGELTPNDVVCSSDISVWWLGECGHEWDTTVKDRTKLNGTNCPYCNTSNPKVLRGFNDIWTVNPELASLLVNSEDGYKYTQGSNKKLNWVCNECGNIVKNKSISHVKNRGLSCPKCSDGFKYPERFMYCLLKQLNVEFEYQKTFNWAKNKRYDFYIPSLNMIIETHGEQHYNDKKSYIGRTLTQEKENDSLKLNKAIENDIEKYIIIDCSESSVNYISKSILNSEMTNYFNLIDIEWSEIGKDATKSKLIEVCEIYKSNDFEQKEIAKITGLNEITVRRYLKLGNELGLVNYEANSKRNKDISIKHFYKEVVQLDLNGNFMNEFISIHDAGLYLEKKNYSAISACCKGKLNSAFGFRWMYKMDYTYCKEGKKDFPKWKNNRDIEIVQLTKDGIFINKYKSINEASHKTKVGWNGISNCCKGKYNQSGGFKWMYYEEFLVQQNKQTT